MADSAPSSSALRRGMRAAPAAMKMMPRMPGRKRLTSSSHGPPSAHPRLHLLQPGVGEAEEALVRVRLEAPRQPGAEPVVDGRARHAARRDDEEDERPRVVAAHRVHARPAG